VLQVAGEKIQLGATAAQRIWLKPHENSDRRRQTRSAPP
jgi:hypothetical protein